MSTSLSSTLPSSSAAPPPPPRSWNRNEWDLAAEAITVRIRWFGLCVGYALVNLAWHVGNENQAILNAILTLGLAFSLVDTWYSLQGRVFLEKWPLLVSGMEALFIGLLCHFDQGLNSPFRFYYFLSLLVCAMRHSPVVTYLTLTGHTVSFMVLGLLLPRQTTSLFDLSIMLILMGWVTWASTSLASLLKGARDRLSELNRRATLHQNELERRIAERTDQLQESQALVVQQEKQAAFGLLAAGIAHEVGNPLAAISSLVQLLQRRPQEEYTRERLQMVDDQMRRIRNILRELVNFARPAGTERRLCAIDEVIGEALNIAKYYKRMKGKQVVTNYPASLPVIRVVSDQLVQVLLNLVLNAMDATDEGGTITIGCIIEPDSLCVTVQDSGHGIAPEHVATVFQPYFTTKENGTGLGLFVSRRIMEQVLGGRIDLVETSSRGTTFAVRVPVEAATAPTTHAAV